MKKEKRPEQANSFVSESGLSFEMKQELWYCTVRVLDIILYLFRE